MSTITITIIKIYCTKSIFISIDFRKLSKNISYQFSNTVGKFAVDKSLELGSNFVKGKIEGLGMRTRTKRRATQAQLEAFAEGRATRGANRYGGALFVAQVIKIIYV